MQYRHNCIMWFMLQMSAQTTKKKKLRILMLHGYYQSGGIMALCFILFCFHSSYQSIDIFSKKTGSFRKMLRDIADFGITTSSLNFFMLSSSSLLTCQLIAHLLTLLSHILAPSNSFFSPFPLFHTLFTLLLTLSRSHFW